MQNRQIDAETSLKLKSLLNAVSNCLDSDESPHLEAISQSFMNHGEESSAVMKGGNIRMPSRPPLKHDKRSVSKLHRETLESNGGALASVIVSAERPDTDSSWTLSTKLVFRVDHEGVVRSRRSIDERVKAALLAFVADGRAWRRLSFGKDTPSKSPVVVIGAGKPVQKVPPSSELQQLLLEAEELYSDYGMNLKSAYWTQRKGAKDIEFREYFE